MSSVPGGPSSVGDRAFFRFKAKRAQAGGAIDRLLERMRLAVRHRGEGQLLAEWVARASAEACVVVARRRAGWRVEGAAGVTPSAEPVPAAGGSALTSWAARTTGRAPWHGQELLHGRRRVGCVLVAGRITPSIAAACRAVEPYFAALDGRREAAAPSELGLAALAHDLRQPLTSVGLWLTLLAEQQPGEAVTRCLHTLERMDEMLQELLLLGSTPRRFDEELALAPLVAEVVEQRQPVAARRRVRLVMVEEAQPRVRGNRTALGRALSNVISNAIVHGPSDNEVTITVGSSDGLALVQVRDAGPGAPAALRERVFDPLFTTARNATGLGLAVTRAAVAAHGGRAYFDAGPASVLHIELPLAGDAAPLSCAAAAP